MKCPCYFLKWQQSYDTISKLCGPNYLINISVQYFSWHWSPVEKIPELRALKTKLWSLWNKLKLVFWNSDSVIRYQAFLKQLLVFRWCHGQWLPVCMSWVWIPAHCPCTAHNRWRHFIIQRIFINIKNANTLHGSGVNKLQEMLSLQTFLKVWALSAIIEMYVLCTNNIALWFICLQFSFLHF